MAQSLPVFVVCWFNLNEALRTRWNLTGPSQAAEQSHEFFLLFVCGRSDLYRTLCPSLGRMYVCMSFRYDVYQTVYCSWYCTFLFVHSIFFFYLQKGIPRRRRNIFSAAKCCKVVAPVFCSRLGAAATPCRSASTDFLLHSIKKSKNNDS